MLLYITFFFQSRWVQVGFVHLGCVLFRIFGTLWLYQALERRIEAAFVCWHRMHPHKKSFVSVRIHLKYFTAAFQCCVSLVTCRHLALQWRHCLPQSAQRTWICSFSRSSAMKQFGIQMSKWRTLSSFQSSFPCYCSECSCFSLLTWNVLWERHVYM